MQGILVFCCFFCCFFSPPGINARYCGLLISPPGINARYCGLLIFPPGIKAKYCGLLFTPPCIHDDISLEISHQYNFNKISLSML